MSRADISTILQRIESAEVDSPIAVFWETGQHPTFQCVYGATSETRRWLKDGVYPLVGLYTRHDDREVIRQRLMDCEDFHRAPETASLSLGLPEALVPYHGLPLSMDSSALALQTLRDLADPDPPAALSEPQV